MQIVATPSGTLSGRIGKVVASHAEVARSIPGWAETTLTYTIYARGAQGVLPMGWGCDLSIGYTVYDAIVPLSVAGWGRRQLGVLHWDTSVD